MSSCIGNIFTRADLTQVRGFLLHGAESCEPEAEPYHTRLKNGHAAIYKRLESIYPNETHRDEATAELSQALGAYESVYTEIGIKVGARILYQLLLAEE
ncbi:MAG: hypothetical protein FWE08_07945 [Oscillospiraceae bacterium]|nr:hypothetical protein [Oscillospiraceae bacterium]